MLSSKSVYLFCAQTGLLGIVPLLSVASLADLPQCSSVRVPHRTERSSLSQGMWANHVTPVAGQPGSHKPSRQQQPTPCHLDQAWQYRHVISALPGCCPGQLQCCSQLTPEARHAVVPPCMAFWMSTPPVLSGCLQARPWLSSQVTIQNSSELVPLVSQLTTRLTSLCPRPSPDPQLYTSVGLFLLERGSAGVDTNTNQLEPSLLSLTVTAGPAGRRSEPWWRSRDGGLLLSHRQTQAAVYRHQALHGQK